MKKNYRTIMLQVLLGVGLTANAWAVPMLQVGVTNGVDSNGVVQYVQYTNNGIDNETAFSNGNTIVVGGVVAQGNKSWQLGGKVGGGNNYSSFTYSGNDKLPLNFDSYLDGANNITTGAIMIVSVPNGQLNNAVSSLMLNNEYAFFSAPDFSYFPNNHAPAQADLSDFLFFDIGTFSDKELVYNFADINDSPANGEIKTITLSGMENLEWIHFDVMAIATEANGKKSQLKFNPGSHDATWNNPGNATLVDPADIPQPNPEPTTIFMFGSGLVGMGLRFRKKINFK